jgi:hypothetical protein
MKGFSEMLADNDVVHVRFNYPAYISMEKNPFDPYKLLDKAQGHASGIESVLNTMLQGPNMVSMGQVIEMTYRQAKPYVNKKLNRIYHEAGVIGSYAEDKGWKHEIPLAEIIDTVS